MGSLIKFPHSLRVTTEEISVLLASLDCAIERYEDDLPSFTQLALNLRDKLEEYTEEA